MINIKEYNAKKTLPYTWKLEIKVNPIHKKITKDDLIFKMTPENRTKTSELSRLNIHKK